MVTIEATGGPLECARCGRTGPGDDWGSLMLNGRLVQIVCPGCLDPTERAEIAGRDGAALYEVVPGRRADAATLRGLAQHPWLDTLDDDAQVVGVLVEEEVELRALWVAGGSAAVIAMATRDWLALEEVVLPPRVRELARRVASGA